MISFYWLFIAAIITYAFCGYENAVQREKMAKLEQENAELLDLLSGLYGKINNVKIKE